MKVTAVSRYNQVSTQNKIAFKGLWGDTKKINKVTSNELTTDIYNFETKEYFPFADDHLESFQEILKESTYHTITFTNKENWRLHTGLNICIKPYLLFSKKQWLDYNKTK